MREYPVERYFRDIRINQIYEARRVLIPARRRTADRSRNIPQDQGDFNYATHTAFSISQSASHHARHDP